MRTGPDQPVWVLLPSCRGNPAEPDLVLFDDDNASLFCITTDPDDQRLKRLRQSLPGIRPLWDFDGAVSRLYGAEQSGSQAGSSGYIRFWLVIDPMLRILYAAPLAEAEAVMKFIAALPPCSRHAGVEMSAPVLILPRVFEPSFCQRLIGLYQASGGQESGFMREKDGRTVMMRDPSFKRRRDYESKIKRRRSACSNEFIVAWCPRSSKAPHSATASRSSKRRLILASHRFHYSSAYTGCPLISFGVDAVSSYPHGMMERHRIWRFLRRQDEVTERRPVIP